MSQKEIKTGGLNFFVPDFNKLPYSLRSQGDNLLFSLLGIKYFNTKIYEIVLVLEIGQIFTI